MTYPLNMTKPAASRANCAVGFALANTPDEHKKLSDQGYLPAFAPAADDSGEETKRKPGRPRKTE